MTVPVDTLAATIRAGFAWNRTIPDKDAADEALDALVARASQAEADRDAWMTSFDGSGIEWHESLPSSYTYQAADFPKLVAAVHEYECRALDAEALAARLREERDALQERDHFTSLTIRQLEHERDALRDTLTRIRPDIDPETGYGRVEAI